MKHENWIESTNDLSGFKVFGLKDSLDFVYPGKEYISWFKLIKPESNHVDSFHGSKLFTFSLKLSNQLKSYDSTKSLFDQLRSTI